jgi:nitrate/TMAO reductase-like tetraheme cytochrome c subunit
MRRHLAIALAVVVAVVVLILAWWAFNVVIRVLTLD